MKINIQGVEKPQDNRVAKVITPGVQQLQIVKLEDKTASTGTAFVEVTFNTPENPVEYPLVERFFVSPKIKWRIVHFLNEVLGRELTEDEIDTDILKPELLGKINTYVVDGEEYPKQGADGKVYTNVRARLAFNNFINPPAGIEPYIKALPKVADEDSTLDSINIGSVTSKNDDLPF